MTSSPHSLMEHRRHLLALLIDAYLQDQSPILVTQTVDGIRTIHPALSDEIPIKWTHLEALANEGKIYLNVAGGSRLNWHVNIPTRVLADLEAGDRDLLGVAPGDERVGQLMHGSTFNTFFAGSGIQNLAVNSPGSSVSGSIHVEHGNLDSLLSALEELNVPADCLEDLRTGIESIPTDQQTNNAKRWFGDVATNALGGTLAGGVLSSHKEVIEWLSAVAEALTSFGIPM